MRINVINARGESELFSLEKVRRSVIKSGGSQQLAEKVAREIETLVYPGIETKQIFKAVKGILKRENLETSMRFSLRDGIRKLGPAGFGFENMRVRFFLIMAMQLKLINGLKENVLITKQIF